MSQKMPKCPKDLTFFKLFPTDFNTAATVIASFGVSLGTSIMTPMTVALTDAYGWRIRNYACCAILLFVAFPAVLLWTQPLEGMF